MSHLHSFSQKICFWVEFKHPHRRQVMICSSAFPTSMWANVFTLSPQTTVCQGNPECKPPPTHCHGTQELWGLRKLILQAPDWTWDNSRISFESPFPSGPIHPSRKPHKHAKKSESATFIRPRSLAATGLLSGATECLVQGCNSFRCHMGGHHVAALRSPAKSD